MRTRLHPLGLFVLPLAALSFAAAAAKVGSDIPVTPDFDGIKSAVAKTAELRWNQVSRQRADPEQHLVGIEIRSIQSVEWLVPDAEVFLTHAVAEASWWKVTAHLISIFLPEGKRLKELFTYDGGYNGRGLDFEVIDVGTPEKRFLLLRVSDYDSGNQMSETRDILFQYNPETKAMREVFNVLTSFEPPNSLFSYESTLTFRASAGPVKEVIIETALSERSSEDDTWTLSTPISIFTWDGVRYQGKLKVPKEGF